MRGPSHTGGLKELRSSRKPEPLSAASRRVELGPRRWGRSTSFPAAGDLGWVSPCRALNGNAREWDEVPSPSLRLFMWTGIIPTYFADLDQPPLPQPLCPTLALCQACCVEGTSMSRFNRSGTGQRAPTTLGSQRGRSLQRATVGLPRRRCWTPPKEATLGRPWWSPPAAKTGHPLRSQGAESRNPGGCCR